MRGCRHINERKARGEGEGDKVIGSVNTTSVTREHLTIEQDATTNVMTVHIGSGLYEFQAVWN